MDPRRIGSQARVIGQTELRNDGVLRSSSNRISRKSPHEMLHIPGPMLQGKSALTFALNGGRHLRAPHSPPGCYLSTFPLRRKRLFAAYPKVGRALQRVTISLSRACLYPPSKAARLFSCLLRGCWSSDVTRPKNQGVLSRWSGFVVCFEESVSLPGSSVRFASSWVRRTMAEAFTDPDRPATSLI